MKLRPTKSDRKALDKLKKLTGETTYTKAIMVAVTMYPEKLEEIANLREALRKAHDQANQYEQAAGFILDGLEALKRLRPPE